MKGVHAVCYVALMFLGFAPAVLLHDAMTEVRDLKRENEDLRNGLSSKRSAYCLEMEMRYRRFQQLMDRGDVAGAIVAFESPAGYFSTTSFDMSKLSATKIVSDISGQPPWNWGVKDWPPEATLGRHRVEHDVASVMKIVRQSCHTDVEDN